MKKILVTGGSGQLANCIKDLANEHSELNFLFVDVDKLDITNVDALNQFFDLNSIAYCINCAAYTAVDLAESNKEIAERINVAGAKNLAEVCRLNRAILIHISTDFVFDGQESRPYKEEDKPNPISVYGRTKLDGETAIKNKLNQHIIIRTSWLYSEHGINFLKTMLRLGEERDELNVVADQIGTPTYAGDLAKVIIHIIKAKQPRYGIYHYSNEGVASWYDFAKAIFEESGSNILLSPINTENYPTPAKRPSFSLLDKAKIKKSFGISIPYWRDSLKKGLDNLISNTLNEI